MMIKHWVDAVVEHPRRVFVALGIALVFAAALMVRVNVDTDPENMLSATEPVRVFHNGVKAQFNLHDTIVLGVTLEEHPEGVFNPESLARIFQLAKRLEEIEGVIVQDILSLVHVDNIRHVARGGVAFDWLLSEPPTDQATATEIRAAAKRLPMLDGTLISEDGKSTAIYVPVESKDLSLKVAGKVRRIIADLDGPERYHFAGLPVAEDTFGYEMFKQMAIAAPAAAGVIFLLMWIFFRSLYLILAPMAVALSTVIIAMGLLIGSGFTVHIMSSMIPIFLMPIAVVDSIHILSEFADRYSKGGNAKEIIKEVIRDLFVPMAYTSLTSAAGFASLVLTPIPPVQVFGAYVAIGIGAAFVLTIVFVPAYLVSLNPGRLASLQLERGDSPSTLDRLLRVLRDRSLLNPKLIVLGSIALFVWGCVGVTTIHINDNPVRWFRSSHPIRVADRVLNAALAGTYPAYLVVSPSLPAEDPVEAARRAIVSAPPDVRAAFERLVEDSLDELDTQLDERAFGDTHSAFWEAASDAYGKAEAQGQRFKEPKWLNWMVAFQQTMNERPDIGKTTSIGDVVQTVHRELRGGQASNYTVPSTRPGVAETLLTFQNSHRPDDIFHLVTPDYRDAAVWFQLRSGDNQDMSTVRDAVEVYITENPPPEPATFRWAGLTYINVVWQEKMVAGMLQSLLGAFVVVFIMMVLLFRSLAYGLLSMIPLVFTIVTIYGATGWIGKDYDMPVAVLSSLSLGLSIDFAIHFLERLRNIHRDLGSWRSALFQMFEEPGRAIARNAVVIAVGFLPLLLAPLVPYNTVGVLMAAIMAISSVVTLMLLPAIFAIRSE